MSLYIEPPTGDISLHKLEAFATKRLEFLLKVLASRGDAYRLHELVCDVSIVTDSDCLIPGSVKDKVSHFILRLLIGGDPETQAFFCRAETALFDFHFSCMSEDEMKNLFYKINKVLKKTNSKLRTSSKAVTVPETEITSILDVFNHIKQCGVSWKKVIELYMVQCSAVYFLVPFQYVLQLVRKRQVTLERGLAKVPFSKLREVVQEQFSSLMQLAVVQAAKQFHVAMADNRLRLLWGKLNVMYRRQYPAAYSEGPVPGISLEQVDSMAIHFPLCMSSLLQSLRIKHRLGHHARIQLTLFLKDLGLPVHHAIALWQQEYSLPNGAGSQCKHSWKSDGRRYTYSIRHLYGLEGARRNYRGHCCESLQQCSVGCGHEGGCPFSHRDDETLSAELSRLGLHSADVTDVLSVRASGKLFEACQRCLDLTTARRISSSYETCTKNVAVKALDSCFQVDISSSPDLMKRTDSSFSDCDIEDLVVVGRANPANDKSTVCLLHGGSDTKNMDKMCATRSTFYRIQYQSDVCMGSAMGAESTDPSSSFSNCASNLRHYSHVAPNAKPNQDDPYESIDGCNTCQGYPDKVKAAQPSADTACNGRGQNLHCVDHDVCPSQDRKRFDLSTAKELSASFPIQKPVQFFHLSYQHLLLNLKS